MKKFFSENTNKYSENVFAVKITVLLMLVAHGFQFTNVFFSHDSVHFAEDATEKISIGRWLYPVILKFRHFATPYLTGVIATVFIALSVVVIANLFELNKVGVVVIAVVFSTNITLTVLFATYYYDADADALAVLLACVAVYCTEKLATKWRYFLSAMAIVAMFALYQTYFCLIACLYLLVYSYKTKDVIDWQSAMTWMKSACLSLGTMLISTVIYYISIAPIAKINGVELSNDDNGPKRLEAFGTDYITGFFRKAFFEFRRQLLYTGGKPTVCINMAVFALIVIEIVVIIHMYRNRKVAALYLIFCVGLLPFAAYGFLLLSMGLVHQLMIFAYSLMYFTPLVLLKIIETKDKYKKWIRVLSTTCLMIAVCVGFNNIVYSNGVYVYKKLVFDNTSLHAHSIWEKVNSLEDYEEGITPVVIMGTFEGSKAEYKNRDALYDYSNLLGNQTSSITYEGIAGDYFYYILGREMLIEYDDEQIINDNRYKRMPVYPQEGYCQMMEGKVVVKMR